MISAFLSTSMYIQLKILSNQSYVNDYFLMRSKKKHTPHIEIKAMAIFEYTQLESFCAIKTCEYGVWQTVTLLLQNYSNVLQRTARASFSLLEITF